MTIVRADVRGTRTPLRAQARESRTVRGRFPSLPTSRTR
jgi:hypothetical protein